METVCSRQLIASLTVFCVASAGITAGPGKLYYLKVLAYCDKCVTERSVPGRKIFHAGRPFPLFRMFSEEAIARDDAGNSGISRQNGYCSRFYR